MVDRVKTPEKLGKGSESTWIDRVSEWIRSEIPSTQAELLESTLQHLRGLFDAPRALMLWEEADEPWVNLACAGEPEGFIWKQTAPSRFNAGLSEDMGSTPFFWSRSGPSDDRTSIPIDPELQREFSIESALGFDVESEQLRGRVFLLDLESVDSDQFALAELAAAIVERLLGEAIVSDHEDVFLVDEKIRTIARDLHDGLLQSFTGIVLKLENLLPLIGSNAEEARKRVTEIEAALMNEQRELRSYLESLHEKKRIAEIEFDMNSRMQELVHRYHDQWGVEIEFRRDTLEPLIREALGWETYRIITEAITNATRHGQAKHVEITLSTADDRLHVIVEDDGEGFPFRGRRSGLQLMRDGIAPGSLTERVHSLNGEIVIESTDEGSRLEIRIPIGWSSA
ncbi:MAG: histidine kinase [Thermoanaerobaculia bacterium]|nr:histidine kinase [Thermoanaerobaculia bacterium]